MTTEAGKRLLLKLSLFDLDVDDYYRAKDSIAAIEAEAVNRYAEAMAVGEAAIRRDERKWLQERVKELRLDTDTGLTTQDPAVVWDNAIDAVLAILEDETR